MKFQVVRSALSVIVAVSLFATASCDSERAPIWRATGVPQSAWWIGGPKGNWVDCQEKSRDLWNCALYDIKGNLIRAGDYRWESKDPGEFKAGSRGGWDGKALVFHEGTLVPIGIHRGGGFRVDFDLPEPRAIPDDQS